MEINDKMKKPISSNSKKSSIAIYQLWNVERVDFQAVCTAQVKSKFKNKEGKPCDKR